MREAVVQSPETTARDAAMKKTAKTEREKGFENGKRYLAK
jgi:hypothetical protein